VFCSQGCGHLCTLFYVLPAVPRRNYCRIPCHGVFVEVEVFLTHFLLSFPGTRLPKLPKPGDPETERSPRVSLSEFSCSACNRVFVTSATVVRTVPTVLQLVKMFTELYQSKKAHYNVKKSLCCIHYPTANQLTNCMELNTTREATRC
jgi:hypothetical protein